MSCLEKVLKKEEKALYQLRRLYRQYGYSRYKVSKFEEYDLYAYNKRFLISEHVLTFTDTNGKLMALKPDVTLSIVKNIQNEDRTTQKLYYNETVYRTAHDSDGFREIMQTGLECIGNVDLYATGEVLLLAKKSLELIHDDSILVLSHMGFLAGLLEEAGIDAEHASELLESIKSKNLFAIRAYCKEKQIPEEIAEALCGITSLYEPISVALPRLCELARSEKMKKAYDELCGIYSMLSQADMSDRVYLDFSIVNDVNYYSGVIFQGYVNGISEAILSGGRYDSLLAKMGKTGGAIGFAVYLNLLERLTSPKKEYDADTLVLYSEQVDPVLVMKTVETMQQTGSVLAKCGSAENAYCRRTVRLTEGGETVVEEHD